MGMVLISTGLRNQGGEMSIRIRSVHKVVECGYARLESEVDLDGERLVLWNETYDEWSHAIEDADADAFLVALLPKAFLLAMQGGSHTLYVDPPVSEELVYQINTILVPILAGKNAELSGFKVQCSEFSKSRYPSEGVCSSFSLGVDSYCTVADSIVGGYPNFAVSHLMCYEFDFFKQYPYPDKLIGKARSSARELGLPLVEVWSNIPSALTPPSLFGSHTYWLASAAITFRRAWGKYLIPSSYPTDELPRDFLNSDCSHYENVLLGSLSTAGLSFFLSGVGVSRFEKTSRIADLEVTWDSLTPCWKFSLDHNCGYCGKCIRTMIDLDSQGLLERYAGTFDIGYYAAVRDYYLMMMCANKENVFFRDSYRRFKQDHPDLVSYLDASYPLIRAKYGESPSWFLEAAAASGISQAMVNISRLYLSDRHDLSSAMAWMKKAVDSDSRYFDAYVGLLLDSHDPMSRSVCKEMAFNDALYGFLNLDTAARLRSRLGQGKSDLEVFIESFVDRNPPDLFPEACVEILLNNMLYSTALHICASYVDRDDTAKAYLGRMYREGWGVKRDLLKAEILLEEAFRSDCRFLYDYTKCLVAENTPESLRKAFGFIKTGIRWGLSRAHLQMGLMYREGIGIEKDLDKAIQHISKASESESWFLNVLTDTLVMRGRKQDLKRALQILSENKFPECQRKTESIRRLLESLESVE